MKIWWSPKLFYFSLVEDFGHFSSQFKPKLIKIEFYMLLFHIVSSRCRFFSQWQTCHFVGRMFLTSSSHGTIKSHRWLLLVSTVKQSQFTKFPKLFFTYLLGRLECELNKLHSCILEHQPFEQAFQMISCLMRSFQSNIDDVRQRMCDFHNYWSFFSFSSAKHVN